MVDEIMVLGSAGIEWPGPRDTTHHAVNEILLPSEESSCISADF